MNTDFEKARTDYEKKMQTEHNSEIIQLKQTH